VAVHAPTVLLVFISLQRVKQIVYKLLPVSFPAQQVGRPHRPVRLVAPRFSVIVRQGHTRWVGLVLVQIVLLDFIKVRLDKHNATHSALLDHIALRYALTVYPVLGLSAPVNQPP